MSRTLLVVVGGALAVLATATTVCLEVIAVVHLDKTTTRAAFATAASLEFVVLLTLGFLAASRVLRPGRAPSIGSLKVALGLEILACALAAAASAVALAYLSKSRTEDADEARGASLDAACQEKLLAVTSVAAALATAWQLMFMTLHFVSSRKLALGGAPSERDAEDQRAPGFRVSSVRYNRTSPISIQTREMASKESASTKRTTGTRGLFGASLSRAIRSSSSRARLSAREQRRRASLDSTPCRSSTDGSFDSWDTSSVDAHNRQVVLEMLTPPLKARCLETIPASPSTSRSPSPRMPWDLEPPRSVRTSRSCSSSSLRLRDLTPTSSIHELHIHPLFRSDSPNPPPAVSPNTVVVAAPNAGRVISRSESMQSLKRMRSGSLPAGPSPLSHQASVESAKLKKQSDAPPAIEEQSGPAERSMTPPVPEWLLSPGVQASPGGAKQHARAEARRGT